MKLFWGAAASLTLAVCAPGARAQSSAVLEATGTVVYSCSVGSGVSVPLTLNPDGKQLSASSSTIQISQNDSTDYRFGDSVEVLKDGVAFAPSTGWRGDIAVLGGGFTSLTLTSGFVAYDNAPGSASNGTEGTVLGSGTEDANVLFIIDGGTQLLPAGNFEIRGTLTCSQHP